MSSNRSVIAIDCAKDDANWQEQLSSLMRRAPSKIVIGGSQLHPDQQALRASVNEKQQRGQRVAIQS